MVITKEPLDLSQTDYQEEIFHNVPKDVHFVVNPKGRRAGMTHGAMKACLKWMIKHHKEEGCKILWIDTIDANIINYFEIYLEPELKKIDTAYWNFNRQTKVLKVFNSRMIFKSAERNANIEGDGFHYIILNETGIILKGKRGRTLWVESVLPMVMDFGGIVFFVGTTKGENTTKDDIDFDTGRAHKYCTYAQLIFKGEDPKQLAWRTIYVTTYQNPFLTRSIIKMMEDETPKKLRPQQFYGKLVNINHDNILKRHYMHKVTTLPDTKLWGRLIISGDTAYTEKKSNDASAFTVGLETDVGYYILDCLCGRWEFHDLCEKLVVFYEKHNFRWYNKPMGYIIIENKASGLSLVQQLKKHTSLPIKDVGKDDGIEGDKVVRVNAVEPLFATGNVFFFCAPWNKDAIDMVIDQLCEFNEAMDTEDDIVDTITQALLYLRKRGRSKIENIKSAKIERRSKILKGY